MDQQTPPGLEPLLDYVTDAVEEGDRFPLPQALVRMFPGGNAARLAAQVLTHADVIELALCQYAESLGHGTIDRSEASDAASTVQEFRWAVADEATHLRDNRVTAPLTGTSARSLVHTLSEAMLNLKTPADGNWRRAAHDQVWRTGRRYVQVWLQDAVYYEKDS